MTERLFRMTVRGWATRKTETQAQAGISVETFTGERTAQIVASSAKDALLNARALLDPANAYPDADWEVYNVQELPPAESSGAQNYDALHAATVTPAVTAAAQPK